MFFLVSFSDGSMGVYDNNHVIFNEQSVTVKDKGGRYKGKLLMSHDSRQVLHSTILQLNSSATINITQGTDQSALVSEFNLQSGKNGAKICHIGEENNCNIRNCADLQSNGEYVTCIESSCLEGIPNVIDVIKEEKSNIGSVIKKHLYTSVVDYSDSDDSCVDPNSILTEDYPKLITLEEPIPSYQVLSKKPAQHPLDAEIHKIDDSSIGSDNKNQLVTKVVQPFLNGNSETNCFCSTGSSLSRDHKNKVTEDYPKLITSEEPIPSYQVLSKKLAQHSLDAEIYKIEDSSIGSDNKNQLASKVVQLFLNDNPETNGLCLTGSSLSRDHKTKENIKLSEPLSSPSETYFSSSDSLTDPFVTDEDSEYMPSDDSSGNKIFNVNVPLQKVAKDTTLTASKKVVVQHSLGGRIRKSDNSSTGSKLSEKHQNQLMSKEVVQPPINENMGDSDNSSMGSTLSRKQKNTVSEDTTLNCSKQTVPSHQLFPKNIVQHSLGGTTIRKSDNSQLFPKNIVQRSLGGTTIRKSDNSSTGSRLSEKHQTQLISKEVVQPAVNENMGDSDNSSTGSTLSRKQKNKGVSKRHCCCFCGKLVVKIGRHLVKVHVNEDEVIKINSLPVNNVKRTSMLEKLRKLGDYNYNLKINENEEMPISCRNAHKYKHATPTSKIPCPECKGFYTKDSLRHHIKRCKESKGKNPYGRDLQSTSRALAQHIVHRSAIDILKERILPKMKMDEVGTIVRQDELIIGYGNRLCRKYRREQYQNYNMIRNKLRNMGKFLIEFKKINPGVNCLREALKLEHTETILKAVEKVANINEDGTKYESCSTAQALSTQLKDITVILAGQYTKERNKEMAEATFSLKELLRVEFSDTIMSTVKETKHDIRRQKQIELPETENVAKFLQFLRSKVLHFYSLLKTKFCIEHWMQLAGYTLVSIQVFNRKRTGEVQNMTLGDLQHYKYIRKDYDNAIYNSLTVDEKQKIKQYIQISLRSKRSLRPEGTPVLVDKLHFNALKCLTEYRHQVGVLKENKFVFGIPDKTNFMTLRASDLLRKYSKESGIPNSYLFTGNNLRKHIASSVSLKGYNEVTKEKLSDFMAHSSQVHKNFYEIQQEITNITKVSGLLEEAAGGVKKDSSIEMSDCSTQNLSQNLTPTWSQQESETEDSNLIPNHSEQTNQTGSLHYKTNAENVLVDNEFSDISGENSSHSTEIQKQAKVENYKKRSLSKRNSGFNSDDSDVSTVQQRRPWRSHEKRIVKSHFARSIQTGFLPTTKECRRFIEKNDVLRHRQPVHVRNFVRYEHQRQNRPIKRRSWETPEKTIVEREFAEHYKRHSLPSTGECTQLKEKFPEILKNRTPEMIKSFFNNYSRQT